MTEKHKPVAWLCELAQEDGTTRTQFVEQDPDGLRWNDAGEPSPYRTTPLFDQAALDAKDAEIERLRAAADACLQELRFYGACYGVSKHGREVIDALGGILRPTVTEPPADPKAA